MPRQTKAERLIAEIEKLDAELTKHQERCKHPDKWVTYKHRSSTGHYDPGDDSYWTEWKCDLCTKTWITDQ